MKARECVWCSRTFMPRIVGANYYALLSAGTWICWECSDLYQEEEVRMRLGEVNAFFTQDRLATESGHTLSLTLLSWKTSHKPWARKIGQAADQYGKLWSVYTKKDHVRLKPLGARP